MAKSRIPNAIAMRSLKYGSASREEREAAAEALRAAGRRPEAILLFEGDGTHPFLVEERDWAAAEGAGFHLLSILRMGAPVEESHLRACAEAAEARGRWMDARSCWLELGDEAAVARIAEHLPPSLRPEGAEEAHGE